MADQRTKGEKDADPKAPKRQSWIHRGQIVIDDGKGGFVGLDGKPAKFGKDFDQKPPEGHRGMSGKDRMAMIRDRLAEQDGSLAARIRAGDTSVKPGASGSGVALEDADEDLASAVDERGDPNFTDGTGQRIAVGRRLAGSPQPLQTTGKVGTRESVRPSRRENKATETTAASSGRRSGSKARTTRSRS